MHLFTENEKRNFFLQQIKFYFIRLIFKYETACLKISFMKGDLRSSHINVGG